MAGSHATLFQPSKATIWTNCLGALALTRAADLPEEPSKVHSASGTCTHSIAERIANGGTPPAVGTKETHDSFEFVIDQDRIDRAQKYVDAVLARGGMQFYEVKLDLAPVILVPEQFGTGDAIVVKMDECALEAHDLKDGNGIVIATTEQLVVYLLAAWREFAYLCDFQIFRAFIHQPKVNWFSEHTYTRAEMEAFELKYRRAASRGQDLIGQSPAKIRAALTAGEHCDKGWCRMRGNCPAYLNRGVESIPDPVDSATVTDAELARIMALEATTTALFATVRGEALARAKLAGHSTVPGWKLTTGREGNRAWKIGGDGKKANPAFAGNEEKIGEILYDALLAEAYERSLISPTTAQKKLKKEPATWAALQEYIGRSEGQLTLVPEADSRPQISLDVPEFEIVDSALDLIG